jgi:hypothetical protein
MDRQTAARQALKLEKLDRRAEGACACVRNFVAERNQIDANFKQRALEAQAEVEAKLKAAKGKSRNKDKDMAKMLKSKLAKLSKKKRKELV